MTNYLSRRVVCKPLFIIIYHTIIKQLWDSSAIMWQWFAVLFQIMIMLQNDCPAILRQWCLVSETQNDSNK